jgi:chaperonin GroES
MKKIKLFNDMVAVKLIEESVSSGGIVIPGTSGQRPNKAKVMAVGPGKALDNGQVHAMTVKVGDTVLLGNFTGTDVKVEGEEFLMIKESEILAILEGDKHA